MLLEDSGCENVKYLELFYESIGYYCLFTQWFSSESRKAEGFEAVLSNNILQIVLDKLYLQYFHILKIFKVKNHLILNLL